jgi:hypothetical protein
MPVDRIKLEQELLLKIADDQQVRREVIDFAEDVKEHWRDLAPSGPSTAHPWATGDYRRSIVRMSSMYRKPKGTPGAGQFQYHHWVGTDDPIAGFLEYGTDSDVNGTGSWIDMNMLGQGTGERRRSKNTPTPAFAYAARTALYYGGTAP